jgi:putative inorganic carbon (hco3(-)) transporter
MTAGSLGLPLDRRRHLGEQLWDGRSRELAAAAATSVLGGCILAATGDWLSFALIGIAFLVALGALRPALFITVVLLVRPCLDDVSDVTAGVRSANLGGAVALALILSTALAVSRQRRVTWPQAAPVLMVALGVSAVSAVQARLKLGAVVGTVPMSEFLRLAALCAAYVAAANLFPTAEKARRLCLIVGLSGVIPGIIGIVEWIRGPTVAEGLGVPRVSGPFVSPVPFATFLAVTALILIFMPRGRLPAWARVAAAILVCVPLVGTLTREGWFVFTAGVVLLGWRNRRAVVVAIAIAVVAVVALVPTVHDRVLPRSQASASAPPTYESWQWRRDNWRGLLEKWREAPVFGYGLRTTIYVNPRSPADRHGQTGYAFEAHSLPVRLLVEGGVILLAAYAAFFAVLIRSVRRLARDPWELQSLGKVLLVIWSALVVVGVTADDPLASTATMMPLLALTGSLDAAHRAWLRQGQGQRV